MHFFWVFLLSFIFLLFGEVFFLLLNLPTDGEEEVTLYGSLRDVYYSNDELSHMPTDSLYVTFIRLTSLVNLTSNTSWSEPHIEN